MSWFLPCHLDGSRPSFLFDHCYNFKIPGARVSYMISCPSLSTRSTSKSECRAFAKVSSPVIPPHRQPCRRQFHRRSAPCPTYIWLGIPVYTTSHSTPY